MAPNPSIKKSLSYPFATGLFILFLLISPWPHQANEPVSSRLSLSDIATVTHESALSGSSPVIGTANLDFLSFTKILAEEREEENEVSEQDVHEPYESPVTDLGQACTLDVRLRLAHLVNAVYQQPRISLFILHHSWKAHLG